MQRLWGAAGKGRGVCVCRGKGHPTSREPPSVSSPSSARAAAATLWPGLPEALATAKSRFCAAAPAPVSLTLEPAAYLSNSKGNSAAAEGKKITSAAEQGGKSSQLGPRCPPTTLPSPERASHCPPRRRPGRPASTPRPGTPTLSEAAGSLWAPLRLLPGKSLAFWASSHPRQRHPTHCA